MHLNAEQIIKIIYDEVEYNEAERFNKHLLECEECSNKLLEMSKLDFYIKNIYTKKRKTILFPLNSVLKKPLFLYFDIFPEYELSMTSVKGSLSVLKNHLIKTKLNSLFIKIIKNRNNDYTLIKLIGLDDCKVYIFDYNRNVISKFNIEKGESIEKKINLNKFIISTLDDEINIIF